MRERNQRRYPRVPATTPACVEFAEGSIEGRIENIGPGGAFFATDTLEGAIEVGDEVLLAYTEGDESCRRSGTVLRLERYFHEGGLDRSLAIRFAEPASP